ncbi:hypothetical protein SAMN04488131_102331 [Flavobacterium xueshanense]|jgi:high-affinity K+ transport system ATPase subunit B|uniref:Uncharacterized protein n=1 Tax=Flavobacterium xueshanense TaxID=935223 RepID=A0A1I2BG97_9FLAO|nr:hypothetical protein SAMN04488131_102331 [Flavobacterium xueshanense]
MKYFITQTLQNTILIVFILIIRNFFKDEKNNDIYKLLVLERIFLILFFSVALASYETYKKKQSDSKKELNPKTSF